MERASRFLRSGSLAYCWKRSHSYRGFDLARPVEWRHGIKSTLAVRLEFVLQRTEADSEQRRRLGSVVPNPGQRLQNISLFELLQGQTEGQLGFFAASFLRGVHAERQIAHIDAVVLAEHDRLLEAVLQLSDITRPVVGFQQLQCAGQQPRHGLSVGGREFAREVLRQQRAVPFAVPQRRPLDHHHRDAVVDVLAERPLTHRPAQILVAGRDQPDVGAGGLAVPDLDEFPCLNGPQQLGLQGQADLADLVDEQCARVGQREEARPVLHGPREAAPNAAEEMAFDQRLGNGRTVQRYERPVRARALHVNGPSDKLLARARLARDAHVGVPGSRLLDARKHLVELFRLPDDPLRVYGVALEAKPIQRLRQLAFRLRRARQPLYTHHARQLMETALTAWFGQHDEGHIYIQSREALLELPCRERGLLIDQNEGRSPLGMDRQLELLQRAHEMRLPVVQARQTADRIRQLQLIVKDQDVHGSELRNPCAITGCNVDRHLQGTQLPKPVAATPILVGGSIPSAGRGLWSAAPNTVQGRPPPFNARV